MTSGPNTSFLKNHGKKLDVETLSVDLVSVIVASIYSLFLSLGINCFVGVSLGTQLLGTTSGEMMNSEEWQVVV